MTQQRDKTGIYALCFEDGVRGFTRVRVSYAYLYNYTKVPIANPRKHVQQLEHV